MNTNLPTRNARIAGIGSYLPERVMTNDELGRTLDTSDEWIVSHTGIRQRYIAAPDESASTMGIKAALRALEDAGMPPTELGLILTSTTSGDYVNFPSTACLIQAGIGATGVAACDLSAACAGFTYALAMARDFCVMEQKPVLLVSTEAVSRILDWQDRATCILFGDGAAAVVLVPSEEPGVVFSSLGADGGGAGVIRRDVGGLHPVAEQHIGGGIEMQGKAVFPFAVRAMERIIMEILEKNNLTLDDVQYIVPHQANLRILSAVAKHMGVPVERFYVNIDRVANTSSASVPIALDEIYRSGTLKNGDLVLTVAFGAGLSYGGNLLRWNH